MLSKKKGRSVSQINRNIFNQLKNLANLRENTSAVYSSPSTNLNEQSIGLNLPEHLKIPIINEEDSIRCSTNNNNTLLIHDNQIPPGLP